MFARLSTAVLTVSALVAVASADFQVLSPGGPDLWWVAKSTNTLVWNCDQAPAQQFTIFIANPNTALLPDRLAIIAVENNFDCSKLITQDQSNQSPGTGYTIQLADTLNSTHIYAESQPFEIKALGSAYPTTTVSAEPSSTGASGSGTATAGASSASNSNAAASSSVKTAVGFGAAAVGALFGLVL